MDILHLVFLHVELEALLKFLFRFLKEDFLVFSWLVQFLLMQLLLLLKLLRVVLGYSIFVDFFELVLVFTVEHDGVFIVQVVVWIVLNHRRLVYNILISVEASRL